MAGELHIGYDRKEKGKETRLPIAALKRHFAALGSSGSGKTVLVKCVMEECIRAGIPLLMVDLQGDLASLALMGDKKSVESKGTPGRYWDEVKNKAQVAIYTPASSKGIPISMNPLKAPPLDLDPEDFIQAVDSVASTVANILGYNTEKGKGLEVKDYLYLLFDAIWVAEKEVKTFGELSKYILRDSSILDEAGQMMIKEKDKDDLAKSVKGMTIGAESLMFNLGIPLDIERMMTWADPGKVPVNVIYLNTLRSGEDKVNFIADIANQTYNWMLRHPSNDVQLVFILDELAGLVPPIRNPPSKKSIQLLLKQARKYGVSMILATQNISDVDYKSLGQVSTWAIGKLIAKQDIEKVKDIISAISPAETDQILGVLPKQSVGQFMLLNPDVYDSVQWIQARWLVTNHTTLDDTRVQEIMDHTGVREKFPDAKGKQRKKSKSSDASPMDAADAVEAGIVTAEEVDADQKDVAVPNVSKVSDVLPSLEAEPLAISAEELAEKTNESVKTVSKHLDKLVRDNKLKVENISGVKIYWSKKHKMDPKNNIVGPMFRFHLEIPQGVAEKEMKKNIPKTMGIRALEKIQDGYTQLYYLPMWKIGVIEKEKRGGMLGIGGKEIEVMLSYYINGLSGGVIDYDTKEQTITIPRHGIEVPDDIDTLPTDLIKDPEVLDGLRDSDLKPTLNRELAIDQVRKLLGSRINRKVVPAICWYPIWEFRMKDKDTNYERAAWIDGVKGSYIDENPLE